VTAPTLETERTRLRSFRADDFDALAAMMSDEAVMRHLGAHPLAREDSWRRMLAAPGLWVLLGYGYWAVERKEDGALIGQIGFADFKRAIEPSIEGIPEMGWIFASHVHGQGYASEAAAAAMRWADEKLTGSFVAIIAPENAPSIGVARKLGFVEECATRYKDEPILLFRRPAPTSA
jgi:RimJ/RimL family protein N-acetyltransferase